jgi:hypothetical protein
VQWDPSITPLEGEDRREMASKWGMTPDPLYDNKQVDEYAKQLGEVFEKAESYFRRFIDPVSDRRG